MHTISESQSTFILCQLNKLLVLNLKKFSERIGKRFEHRINEVMEKFKDETVLGAFGSANFFGQESLGLGQVRGNGVLVLTEKELYFEMWSPKKYYTFR